MLRTLLPVQMIVLMVIATGCTSPSYGTKKVGTDDAGTERDGGEDSPGPFGSPSGPQKPPAGDGGKDAGGPKAPVKPDAATDAASDSACIVGVSRLGECKLH